MDKAPERQTLSPQQLIKNAMSRVGMGTHSGILKDEILRDKFQGWDYGKKGIHLKPVHGTWEKGFEEFIAEHNGSVEELIKALEDYLYDELKSAKEKACEKAGDECKVAEARYEMVHSMIHNLKEENGISTKKEKAKGEPAEGSVKSLADGKLVDEMLYNVKLQIKAAADFWSDGLIADGSYVEWKNMRKGKMDARKKHAEEYVKARNERKAAGKAERAERAAAKEERRRARRERKASKNATQAAPSPSIETPAIETPTVAVEPAASAPLEANAVAESTPVGEVAQVASSPSPEAISDLVQNQTVNVLQAFPANDVVQGSKNETGSSSPQGWWEKAAAKKREKAARAKNPAGPAERWVGQDEGKKRA